VSVPKTPDPPEAPERRGLGADWKNPWPPRGIVQGEPQPSPGFDALRADGYCVIFDVTPMPEDADEYQDHLNNSAAVRMFNELRMAYVAARLAPDWPRYVRRGNLAVVVRELHVEYESEGWMHERFVGGTRISRRRGKSGIHEQHLVEAATARSLARAWLVQLLVDSDGRVIDWPEWYWEAIAAVEGVPAAEIGGERQSWGPPD
jgi:acyl-CoA thioesterase FadM